MSDQKQKKGKGTKWEKLLLGAVIGAAIGSVVGAAVAPDSGKNTRDKIANEVDKVLEQGGKKFDKLEKKIKNKPISLLRRIRLYLKERNERKRK